MFFHSESELRELNELSTSIRGISDKIGGYTSSNTSRILVIGLGGMGLKTVVALKKELNQRLGHIDSSVLRFLAIDTDSQDRNKALANDLTIEEIPLLQNNTITTALRAAPEFRPKTIDDIIPDNFDVALTGEGANQMRLAGRLTLMDLNLFQNVCASIERAITGLGNFITSTLDIHIVAGIGGGSGSGMIVDMPYIVRAVIAKMGLGVNREPRIFGHVYLPNTYSGIPNLDAAKRNGYSALKEIDYYMSLESKKETFDALYPAPIGEFSSGKNIFSQCTLIGGRIAAEMVIADPQEKAIAVCVENLVNQCTSVSGNIATSTGSQQGSITDFFTSQSFMVNVMQALNAIINKSETAAQTGASGELHFNPYCNYNYSVVGASSLKFPTSEIVNKFIGEMFSRGDAVLRGNADKLTKVDIDNFERGIAQPNDIIDKVAKELERRIGAYNADPDTRWTKDSIKTSTHTAPLERMLVDAVTAFKKDGTAIERIVAEANRKAADIFKDPQRGPYYLARLLLLSSTSGDGMQGYYQRLGSYAHAVDKIKNAYSSSLADYEAQKASLIEDMQKSGLFRNNFDRNLDSLKSVLSAIYVTRLKLELCDILKEQYYIDINKAKGCHYMLKSSLDEYYLGCLDVYERIGEIIGQNAVAATRHITLPEVTEQIDPSSVFSLTESIFMPLKMTVASAVNDELAKMGSDDPHAFVSNLVAEIINNRSDWELTPDCKFGNSKVAESFRNFVKNYQPFANITKRKMVDYFDIAYAGRSDADKSNMVQKLIEKVCSSAAPTCNVWNNTYFNFLNVDTLCYRYMVIPNGLGNDSAWGGMFNSLFGTNNNTKNIYWSPDQDAIYAYTLYAMMPIWIHADLTDYELAYRGEVSLAPGLHINEKPTLRPALKDLPALMPPCQWFRTTQGQVVYDNPTESAMLSDIRETIDYAVSHGIITIGGAGSGWNVNIINNKEDIVKRTSSVNLDTFVRKYIADPDHTDADGNILIEKNHMLFDAILENYDSTKKSLLSRGSRAISDTESAVYYLRNQMKLLVKLKDEIEFYKTNFLAPILAEDKRRMNIIARRDFAKYHLFGLVFAEKGSWKYKLGDKAYGIISKFDVQDDHTTAWQIDYMEMAACDALVSVEDFNAHKKLLDERVKTLQRSISDGDAEALADVEISYKAIKQRCEGIISEVENRRISGNQLTENEIARKSFYTEMLQATQELMSLFTD